MKVMQGMMEVIIEIFRYVNNQQQFKKSKLSNLNLNNNKLDFIKSCYEELSENIDEFEIE